VRAKWGVYITRLSLAAILLPCVTVVCFAQTDHRFTFNAGAGFTPLVGGISDRLENGWHVTFGGGYRLTQHFETNLQFTYNGFGVRPLVLSEAGVPDANSHMWSISLDPKLRLGGEARRIDPYVVGSVGYFRRTVEFTEPTVARAFAFDPFFDTVFSTFVPANNVLGNITRGGIGGSLGAGFDVKFSRGFSLFTEARYQYADTGRIPTRSVPVTVGFRW
jgi:hypothetical protein